MDLTDPVAVAAELIRIGDLSGSEAAVAGRAEAVMTELGFDVFRDSLGAVTGVIGPGSTPVAALFDGHIDVVPPSGRWTMSPFTGEIRNGRLFGRGATDMKGGMAAAICGVAAAAARGGLSRRVAVSATVLEETVEGVSLSPILDRLQPLAVVICEPSDLEIKVAQRGRAELVLRIVGTPAHAAFPERAKNPIHLLTEALTVLGIQELPVDSQLGPAILVATDLISDPYPSVSQTPSAVTVRFDRRTVPEETEEGVLSATTQALRAVDGDAFTVSVNQDPVTAYTGQNLAPRRWLPAWRMDPQHELVRALQQACSTAGVATSLGAWGFCTNGSESAGVRGIPTVGFGPGDPRDAHTEDESISVVDIYAAAAVYGGLATQLAGK